MRRLLAGEDTKQVYKSFTSSSSYSNSHNNDLDTNLKEEDKFIKTIIYCVERAHLLEEGNTQIELAEREHEDKRKKQQACIKNNCLLCCLLSGYAFIVLGISIWKIGVYSCQIDEQQPTFYHPSGLPDIFFHHSLFDTLISSTAMPIPQPHCFSMLKMNLSFLVLAVVFFIGYLACRYCFDRKAQEAEKQRNEHNRQINDIIEDLPLSLLAFDDKLDFARNSKKTFKTKMLEKIAGLINQLCSKKSNSQKPLPPNDDIRQIIARIILSYLCGDYDNKPKDEDDFKFYIDGICSSLKENNEELSLSSSSSSSSSLSLSLSLSSIFSVAPYPPQYVPEETSQFSLC